MEDKEFDFKAFKKEAMKKSALVIIAIFFTPHYTKHQQKALNCSRSRTYDRSNKVPSRPLFIDNQLVINFIFY